MLPITNFHSITPKPKMLQQQRMMRSLHGLPTLRLVGPPKSKPIKSRAFASEPNGPPRPRVTKEMVFHELREVSKLVFGGGALIVGLIGSSGYVIETMKSLNPMPAPGKMVKITGEDGKPITIHMQKRGAGDVAVIFDGGVGETSFDWEKVADEVAKFATVVSIDRPALGFSSPGPLPRTSMQVSIPQRGSILTAGSSFVSYYQCEKIAKEYMQVLEKVGGLPKKVILVAHGAGGYNMRELAEELAKPSNQTGIQCNGLVLVDALQENLRSELESVAEPVRKSLELMEANGDTVLKLARFGLIRLINLVQGAKLAEKYTPIALPYVMHFSSTPAHRQGALWENEGIPLTEQRWRDAPACALSFPCVVLSHGRPDMFASMKAQPDVTPAIVTALERKWQDAQIKLAETVGSVPAVHWFVTDAGHCIHHEQPQDITLVVQALVRDAHDGSDDEHGAGWRFLQQTAQEKAKQYKN